MKIITFDVETTGLPDGRPTLKETYRWPFIVQFSWMVYDASKNKVINVEDHIVKLPKDHEGKQLGICPESTAIHGITNKVMLREGKNICQVINMFMRDVRKCKILVAHNLKFDKSMVIVEQIRNGYKRTLEKQRKVEYCTMHEGKVKCNILKMNDYTGKMQYKYPKLIELHEKLFNSQPNNLHNSLIDILVCFRCFGKLYWNVDILTKNRQLNELYSELC
tara:strand:+ start:370 stop:1029 length:660 start_codon:yes stop_codon:yes gene_type:complete